MPTKRNQGNTTELNQSNTIEPQLSILQSAIDRQEQELIDLQTELDRRSDEFADRAAAIVRNSLETAYQKAQTRIMTVEVPRFFDSGGNALPLRSPETPIALLPSIGGEVEC